MTVEPYRRPSRRWRGASLLVLMLWTTACFEYKTVGALRPTQQLPPDLRVTTYDGRVEYLGTSEMVQDTIVGYRGRSRQLIKIPLAYVDLIETKRFRMVDSFVAGGLAVLVFYYMVRGLGKRPLPGGPGTL